MIVPTTPTTTVITITISYAPFNIETKTVTPTTKIDPSPNILNTPDLSPISISSSASLNNNPLKLYLPWSPDALPQIYSQKFFVVTRGEEVGIYMTWSDVMVRVHHVENLIYEVCDRWSDALFIYSTAFEEGTLSIEPIPHGQFDQTAPWVPISSPKFFTNAPRKYYIPTPSEIQRPTMVNKLYVVLKGETVGIFGTRHQVAICTQNVIEWADVRECEDWEEAISLYSEAFYDNKLEVFPVRGGKFDVPI